jgi:hypothetical protein
LLFYRIFNDIVIGGFVIAYNIVYIFYLKRVAYSAALS